MNTVRYPEVPQRVAQTENFYIWRFSEGVCHFERQFQVDGDVARNPSMDR